MPPLPDLLLFALLPLLVLATGIYFATSHTGQQRAPSALAAGAAVAAPAAATILAFLPGEAFYLGLKGIVPVAFLWLLVPLLAWNILPGLVGPTIGSPLSYLEKRFSERTSVAAGVVYLIGRIVVSALILATLARMLSLGLGGLPPMMVAFGIGTLGAICCAACGKWGGLWLNVMLSAVLVVGIPFAVATVAKVNGSPEKIWEIGHTFQRTWIGDPSLNLSESGVTWTLLPFGWTALLVLLLGDEATATRLAQLRSAESVRGAFVTLLAGASFMSIAWMYAGLGVFVYYSEHPRDVQPKWVTNVEPATRLSRTDPRTQLPILDPATGEPQPSLLGGIKVDPASGETILPWDEADVRPETLDRLLLQEQLYNPNSQLPIAEREEVLDETGEAIDPRKLATYATPHDGRPSEMLLHRRATEELWPHFLATHAPVGMRGLLLGGLLAAALAAVDMTGLVGVASLQRFFPRRSASSERVLATLASLMVMVLATLFTFLVPFPAETALFALACSLAPLAALVMFGLTSRRANSGVALATLTFGVVAGTVLSLLLSVDPRQRMHPMWAVTLAFAGTWLMGHLLAMVFGESRRRGSLRGLVLGPSPIGAIGEETPSEINIPESGEPSERWK
jgi:hypothetical protein